VDANTAAVASRSMWRGRWGGFRPGGARATIDVIVSMLTGRRIQVPAAEFRGVAGDRIRDGRHDG